MATRSPAPCIAVVGPANAGKTTLLHHLDAQLQARLASVLVIKGNPDGTGRYLFHAPHLRESGKAEVKGFWGSSTIERICEWVGHGRRYLELALLDFGGRHNPDNTRMLQRCSHYIVVTRSGDDEGARSWEDVCHQAGLVKLASLRSVGAETVPCIVQAGDVLAGTFQHAAPPDDEDQVAALEPLVRAIVALRRPVGTSYVNLHLTRRWTEQDVHEVAGLAPKVRQIVAAGEDVVLGGQAPVWAYLAGLRVAVEADPNARLFFFDPKQEEGLVRIPATHRPGSFPPDVLEAEWDETSAEFPILLLTKTAGDRFLPPAAAQQLESAPWRPVPRTDSAGLYGTPPIWVYGAYTRWLLGAGVRTLYSYDAGLERYVRITP
jgi:hypothetical protein